MNTKLLLRLEQICSSLQSEGWIYVSKLQYPRKLLKSVFYRHPNGSRITIDCYEESILIFKNKKLVKSEKIPLNMAG